jgi:hypothetical protein
VCRARTFSAPLRIPSAERISTGKLGLLFGVTHHIRDLQQTEALFHPQMWNISSAIKGNLKSDVKQNRMGYRQKKKSNCLLED